MGCCWLPKPPNEGVVLFGEVDRVGRFTVAILRDEVLVNQNKERETKVCCENDLRRCMRPKEASLSQRLMS